MGGFDDNGQISPKFPDIRLMVRMSFLLNYVIKSLSDELRNVVNIDSDLFLKGLHTD